MGEEQRPTHVNSRLREHRKGTSVDATRTHRVAITVRRISATAIDALRVPAGIVGPVRGSLGAREGLDDSVRVGFLRAELVAGEGHDLEPLSFELVVELHHAHVAVGGVRQASELCDVNDERHGVLVPREVDCVALNVDRGQAVEARARPRSGRHTIRFGGLGPLHAAGIDDEAHVRVAEPLRQRRAAPKLPRQEAPAAATARRIVARAVAGQPGPEGIEASVPIALRLGGRRPHHRRQRRQRAHLHHAHAVGSPTPGGAHLTPRARPRGARPAGHASVWLFGVTMIHSPVLIYR